jgi:hypothetical protein
VEARAKLEQAEEFCRMLKEWGESREDSLGMRKASEADGWCEENHFADLRAAPA